MIPKHNAQDIDKCIGKYICCAPDRGGDGGRRKKTNVELENENENGSDLRILGLLHLPFNFSDARICITRVKT